MTNNENKNWKKIIIITGGMGFIGSNYLNICVKRYPNYLFINIDSLTKVANINNVNVTKFNNYMFKKVDIRDYSGLEKVFKCYSPTDIINFAAESHVDLSIKTPQLFLDTNIMGTHNLLRLGKEYNISSFFQISTDEVYGSLGHNSLSSTEIDILAPNSPYSASKASAEFIVRSYNKTFGMNTIISRCSNNYGPNQDKTKLIPRFIDLLLKNKKVPLYSDGKNIRDWIFVTDHVEAIDLIFHKGKIGEIYNVGAGHKSEKTNIQITKTLLKLLNKDDSYIEYVKDRPGHDYRYSINSNKIKNELGWKPSVDFENGIKMTIDFYKKKL